MLNTWGFFSFMEDEIWRTISDYPDYEVSNFGAVRRVHDGRIVKQCLDSKGYPSANFRKNGHYTLKVIHRFVAMAFLPNPDNKPCVDHVDADRTNNSVILNEDGSVNYEKSNLRWVTHKENTHNPITLGRIRTAFQDKDFLKRRVLAKIGKGGKTAPKHVYMYTKDGVLIKEFISITEAAKEMGVTNGNICVAVDSPTRSACGYKWYSKRIEPTQ